MSTPDELATLKARLALTEQALKAEREYSAFLLDLLLGRKQPEVRPVRRLVERVSDTLAELLAGPGRG